MKRNRGHFLFPVILLIITFVALLFYQFQSISINKKNVNETLVDLANEKVETINSKFDGIIRALKMLSYSVEQDGNYSPAALRPWLKAAISNMDFKYIGISGPDGLMTLDDGRTLNCKDKDYFQSARNNKISIVKTTSMYNETLFVISVPIYDDSFKGIVVGAYNENMFSSLTGQKAFNGDASFTIFDMSGNVILRSENSNFEYGENVFDKIGTTMTFNGGKAYNPHKIIEDNIEGVVSFSINDKLKYATYRHFGLNDWGIIYGVPDSIVNEQVWKSTRQGVWLSLEIMSCALLLFLLIAKRQKKINEMFEDEIKMYSTDRLTGLKNEPGFAVAARESLDRVGDLTTKTPYIISFDINNFGTYNMLAGKEDGDKVLKAIAGIISKDIRPIESAARYYKDEFYCLMYGSEMDEIISRIEDIDEKFRKTLRSDNTIFMSYGIYRVENKEAAISEMADSAKDAERRVKGSVNKNIGIYNEDFRRSKIRREKMLLRMENALETGEFKALYQPKVNAQSRKIISAESLVRWQTQDERISPDEFIELFEESGFIVKLDFYMLEEVCKKLNRIEKSGMKPIPISVNFSRVHMYAPGFVENVSNILEKYDILPSLIIIEFTETVITSNVKQSISIINELRRKGFIVSLDDFGKGYSSLMLLRNVNVNEIKLDKGFLGNNWNSEKNKNIIRNIVNLAKSIGVVIVAEGIETEEQYRFLNLCGCDVMQGYYFSKPVSENEFDEIMRR